MKSAATKEQTNSRAIAQQFTSGLRVASLPARTNATLPLQLQLDVGKTYQANAAVNVFTTIHKHIPDAALTIGNLYTVKRTVGALGKVEIFDQATNTLYVLGTGQDANFTSIVPRLDDDEHAEVQNNPDSLIYKNYHTGAQPVFSRDHVTEGNTGDCWLLGPLAAMAQSPKWRAHLTANFGINPADFTIRLYQPGLMGALVALQRTVTGHLPTYKATDTNSGVRETVYSGQQTGLPDLFDANPNTAPIWPAIFEKAAAVVMGGYNALDDHEASQGMAMLGGVVPTRVAGSALLDPAWASLKADQFDKEAAITMTTKKNSVLSGGIALMAADIGGIGGGYKGLLEDHVYVVKVLAANDVELHNPHGGHHPTARLSKAEVRDYISWVDCLPGNP